MFRYKYISMALCTTIASPVRSQWRYCSFALNYRYHISHRYVFNDATTLNTKQSSPQFSSTCIVSIFYCIIYHVSVSFLILYITYILTFIVGFPFIIDPLESATSRRGNYFEKVYAEAHQDVMGETEFRSVLP